MVWEYMMAEKYIETNETLSVENWQKRCQSGENVSADVNLVGVSMYPLARPHGDSVRIVPVRRNLLLGDVVMFHTKKGKIVTHRVFKLDENTLQTWGDNCEKPDPAIPYEYVYGLVTHFHRKGRLIYVDTPAWRLYGRIVRHFAPVRRFYKKTRSALFRLVKGIKKQ